MGSFDEVLEHWRIYADPVVQEIYKEFSQITDDRLFAKKLVQASFSDNFKVMFAASSSFRSGNTDMIVDELIMEISRDCNGVRMPLDLKEEFERHKANKYFGQIISKRWITVFNYLKDLGPASANAVPYLLPFVQLRIGKMEDCPQIPLILYAVKCLEHIKSPESAYALLDALKYYSERFHKNPRSPSETSLDLRNSDLYSLCIYLADALAELDDKRAIPDIQSIFFDLRGTDRFDLACCLGRLGDPTGLKELIEEINHDKRDLLTGQAFTSLLALAEKSEGITRDTITSTLCSNFVDHLSGKTARLNSLAVLLEISSEDRVVESINGQISKNLENTKSFVEQSLLAELSSSCINKIIECILDQIMKQPDKLESFIEEIDILRMLPKSCLSQFTVGLHEKAFHGEIPYETFTQLMWKLNPWLSEENGTIQSTVRPDDCSAFKRIPLFDSSQNRMLGRCIS